MAALMLLAPGALSAQTLLTPTVSTTTNEVWNHLQFSNGGRVLADAGDGVNLSCVAVSPGSDAQLWKLVFSTAGGTTAYQYELVAKSGRKMAFASSRFIASSTATASVFRFTPSGHATIKGWMLGRQGGSYFNRPGGASATELGEYSSTNDGNGPVNFMLPSDFVSQPPVDAEGEANPKWYYIKSVRRNSQVTFPATLTDKGEANVVKWDTVRAGSDAQQWKLVGAQDSFRVVSKQGFGLYYPTDTNKFKATATLTGANKFKLESYGATTWQLKNLSNTASGGYLNQSGENTTQYSAGDAGAEVDIIPVAGAGTSLYTFAATSANPDMGMVIGTPSSKYAAGQAISITAQGVGYYAFEKWTNAAGELLSSTATLSFTLGSDTTLVANFVLDLPASPMPALTTAGDPSWYYVQVGVAGRYLTDKGDNATGGLANLDYTLGGAQLWRINASTATPGQFELVSASGRQLLYSSSRFYTAAPTGTTPFAFEDANIYQYTGWLLKYNGSASTSLRNSNGDTVRVGNSGTVGTTYIISFIAKAAMEAEYPAMPTLTAPDALEASWYSARSLRGATYMQDDGEGAPVALMAREVGRYQEWKFVSVGRGNDFIIVNASNRALYYDAQIETGRILSTSNLAEADTFRFAYCAPDEEPAKYIQLQDLALTNRYINQTGTQLTVYSYYTSDARGNSFTFALTRVGGGYVKLNLSANDNAAGYILPIAGQLDADGSVIAGSTITLQATPNSGSVFVRWEDGDGATLSTSAEYTLTPTAELTIVAIFQSGNANLSELRVDGTRVASFSATRYAYTVTVPEGTTSVLVEATAQSDKATVLSGTGTTTLTSDSTVISVRVAAEISDIINTYTITVLREKPVVLGLTTSTLQLNAYPNPVVNDELIVNNEQLKAGDKIEVYTLGGALLKTYLAAGAKSAINLSGLPVGTYIVKAGNAVAKVVKQ
jgi:hypothetical protein